MKKTILISLLSGISYISVAQCNFAPPCNNPITGSYLTNQSFNGDQCFQGPMTISTSVNWNNIYNWTFNDVLNHQTINLPYGGNIYTNGYTTLNQVNFTGNGHLYVQGGETHIFSGNSNNSNQGSYNTVTLSNDALFFYDGIQYEAGDTIQLSGNASNRIYVLGCNNIPLNTTFEKFELRQGNLYWKVNSTGYKLHMQYASTSDPTLFNTECAESPLSGSCKAYEGYYRLLLGNEVSDIIFVKWSDINPANQSKRVELYRMPELNLIATKIIR